MAGISSLLAQMTKEEVLQKMRPSTGIEEEPRTFWTDAPYYGIWIGLGIVALALALMAWGRFRRGRPTATPMLPHLQALRELQRIEALDLPGRGQFDRYCTDLSNVVRHYVEQRLRVPATKQTTPEFLDGMRSANQLNADQQASLGDFLHECDLVKFAGVTQSTTQCQTMAAAARRFIEQTK